MRRSGSSALLCLAIICMAGCASGSSSVSQENDRLRRELLDAQKQLASAESRLAELQTTVRQLSDRPGEVSAEVRLAMPLVQRLEIDRLSHVRDTDGDGRADTLVVYLRPLDGRERFMQIAGVVTVTAALLPRTQDAITLARRVFTPAEVRDAYRTGITGTHYTFELPIDPELYAAESSTTVRVIFVDPGTGVEHSQQREVKLS